MTAEPVLVLEAVDAAYARRPVLHGVSLTVAPGEIVALLGPNGAGKSTVLKAVHGQARVTAGRVRVAGEDTTGLRPPELLRRGVAYLPQGGQVFEPLSVADNLALAAAVLPREVAPTDGGAALLQAFPILVERRRQRAGSLSGGEKQQLATAMALLGQPSVLLVDEPTIGLAPHLAQQALALLTDVRDRLNAAVLLVEQNVALALAVADRAVLLVSGELVDAATRDELAADEARRRRFTYGLAPESA